MEEKRAVCGFGAYITPYVVAPLSESAKVDMEDFELLISGTAASTARTLHNLGLLTTLFIAVGQDPQADWVKQELEKSGIDCTPLSILPRTPYCINIVAPDGSGDETYIHRQEFVDNLDLSEITKEITEKVRDLSPALSLASGIAPRHKPLVQAMWQGAPGALKVLVPSSSLLEGGYDPADLFQSADLVITNQEEAEMLFGRPFLGEKEAQELYERYQPQFVITAGEDGSYMVSSNGCFYQPIVEVDKIQDTIGCGDAYIAGLLKCLVEGKGEREAMRFAAAASAVATTKMGVTPPTIEEVEDFLQKSD